MTNSNSFKQDSWEKGAQFENYVETVLFPKQLYKLLHKTNDYSQNSQRYVDSSQKPDFKFKCLTTGLEFWVEAKYRSKSYNNKYELLSEQQFSLFPKMLEECEKICIALGYGGSAEEPGHVAIIPMREVKSRFIKPTTLENYRSQKDIFQSHQLQELFSSQSLADTKSIKVTQSINALEEHKEIKRKNSRLMLLLAMIAIVSFVGTFYLIKSLKADNTEITPEERIEENVLSYYSAVNSHDYDAMSKFLNPVLENWYGAHNLSANKVITTAKEDLQEFQMSESIVDRETIKVIPNTDGRYYVTFNMVHRKKKRLEDSFKTYTLKMVTYWNEKLKLVQVSEIRL